MKILSVAFLSVLLLSSCGDTDSTNVSNFNSPETVGTLSDGRIVKCVKVERSGLRSSHWIYYVEQVNGKTTMTSNYMESHGKTSSAHATIFIDGVEYQKKENR